VSIEYSLQEISNQIDGVCSGDSGIRITGVAPFDQAAPGLITFAGQSKFLKRIDTCRAGAIIVPQDFEATGKNLIRVKNPQLAFARVVELYHPKAVPPPGIHTMTSIGRDVQFGKDVFVGAFAQIGDRAVVGTETIIQGGAFVGDDVSIGDQVTIHPNVTILNGCRIGNRVTIHAGTVIGSDGYGFVPDDGRYHKVPQIGIVQIDDDVEIGAGNTIDRATFGRTWIQRGVKTDNLVHIAHNVVVGEDSVVVAQVGIAGSTTIGHHAILAGQSGISGHLTLGNHVTVGPMTGVGKSISDGEVVSSGTVAMPHRTWLRVQHLMPSLPDMKKKLTALEKKISDLKKSLEG